jgi:hypothetical protein
MRSAADSNHRNRRVSFKSDVQESLISLDTNPSLVWKDSHHNHKSRKTNNDRSKANYTDQHISSRIRYKIQSLNLNNLSIHNLFFPLQDTCLF